MCQPRLQTCLQTSHRLITSHHPDENSCCSPNRLSSFTIRINIWLYQGYVRASHACKLPIASGRLLTCLLSFSLAQLRPTLWSTAGGTCRRELGNFPSPLMGKLLTRSPRFTLAHLQTLWSTTVGTCHRDLEKFPLPRWETHVLLVVCRAVVSMSGMAQCQS